MFDFFSMSGNHESRKVARFERDDLDISTARVTDSRRPFETAICSPTYNNGEWVIVELYDTREEALKGHERWVAIMTADTLPEKLVDVSEAGVALLLDELADEDWREKAYNEQEY